MKKSVVMIVIFILCFSMTGCRSRDNVIKRINADYFTITYGNSFYNARDKVKQETVDFLVEDYNKIKLVGTTNQELNYDKAITIIFINNEQISAQVTIDDKGICWIDANNINTYIIDKESNIYSDLLKVYNEVQEKYES